MLTELLTTVTIAILAAVSTYIWLRYTAYRHRRELAQQAEVDAVIDDATFDAVLTIWVEDMNAEVAREEARRPIPGMPARRNV